MANNDTTKRINVYINSELAGANVKSLSSEVRKLKSELSLLVPGTQEFIDKSKQLNIVKDRLDEVGKAINGVKEHTSIFKEVFSAAFAVEAVHVCIDAIKEFGKEFIDAFLKSELSAKQLKFAVENIANEKGTGSFDRLMEQAKELQEHSIFSHTDIQNAQTMQLQFGLTSAQVEALTPKILDLASAQGISLADATEKVIKGIDGQTRGLKTAGIEFKSTGDKTENLAIIMQKLGKFTGETANTLDTASGRAKALNNEIEDMQENIGEKLTPIWEGFKHMVWETLGFLVGVNTEMDKMNKRNSEQGQVAAIMEQMKDYDDAKLKRLLEYNSKLVKADAAEMQSISDKLKKLRETDSAQADLYLASVKSRVEEMKGDKEQVLAIEEIIKKRKELTESKIADSKIGGEVGPKKEKIEKKIDKEEFIKLNENLQKKAEIVWKYEEEELKMKADILKKEQDDKTKAEDREIEQTIATQKAKLKIYADYVNAKQQLQNAEMDLLNGVFAMATAAANNNAGFLNAMFLMEKAVAIGEIIVNTTKAINKNRASLAGIPPGLQQAAIPLVTAENMALRVGAAASIAQIGATVIAKFNPSTGGGIKAHAAGGMINDAHIGLVGEKGPEWIAPNWMMQNPATANIIGALEGLRKQGPGSVSNGSSVGNNDLIEVLRGIKMHLDRGIPAYLDYDQNKKTTDQISAIQQDAQFSKN